MNKILILSISIASIALGCNKGPKEIKQANNADATNPHSGIFSDESAGTSDGIDKNLHTVIIKEVLPTEKYVYLKVAENGEEYWIATMKQEVKIGATYFYSEGLLKTNFKSIEHNRTFDKLYLVNSIVAANHGDQMDAPEVATDNLTEIVNTEKIVKLGSVTIAEIVKNPSKYGNKSIQVSGKCVKVNANIMDKNWIHLKDGSKDDYDFVVTSDKSVPVGHTVTFKGKLTLDKDFGAGYKYAIILEDGVLVN